MKTKVCKKCGQEKAIDCFYYHKETKDKHLSFCKECVKKRISTHYYRNLSVVRQRERERYQQRKQDPEFKEKRKIAWRKWYAPEKGAAHRFVSSKLQKERPNQCEICGEENGIIHGHHPDYGQPGRVIWCCPGCHRQIHLGNIKAA